MVAFGECADDGTASTMKARDYKDATDLAVLSVHGTQDPDTNTELAHTLGRNQGRENAITYPLLEIGKRTGTSTTDPRAGLGSVQMATQCLHCSPVRSMVWLYLLKMRSPLASHCEVETVVRLPSLAMKWLVACEPVQEVEIRLMRWLIWLCAA